MQGCETGMEECVRSIMTVDRYRGSSFVSNLEYFGPKDCSLMRQPRYYAFVRV